MTSRTGLSRPLDYALDLLTSNTPATTIAAWSIICENHPESLNDVVFLRDVAWGLAVQGQEAEKSDLAYLFKNASEDVLRGPRNEAENALLDLVSRLRADCEILAELCAHAAAVYFAPALEAIRPPFDWEKMPLGEEARGIVAAAIRSGALR